MATPVEPAQLSVESIKGWYDELTEIRHWAVNPNVAPQLATLYAAIGNRAVRRGIQHRVGLQQEIQGIMAAANPDDMVALGKMASAALYEHDGVTPAKPQERRYKVAKFAGNVIRLRGNHVTPMVDKASRASLLDEIAPLELAEAS
jgi:hypothetical protein